MKEQVLPGNKLVGLPTNICTHTHTHTTHTHTTHHTHTHTHARTHIQANSTYMHALKKLTCMCMAPGWSIVGEFP